jgi:SAM-dependent methyltransferase
MNGPDPTRVLYEQRELPVFQNRMYDSAEAARHCPRGDLVLVENLRTGLVYNAAFRPELMHYDDHYQNEQAVSPLFHAHLESVAEIIERRIGRASVIEVGCGKGYFLELLAARGFDITGFDPTYEGANPRVQRHFFEPGLGIRGDALVLRHVLEHVQHPYEFLEQLRLANGGGGKIYIEVPCFDWICEHRVWFDIYYEHANYFRISDFQHLFGQVLESGRLFGEQYLYVVADLASLRPPERDLQDTVRFPADFTARLNHTTPADSARTAIWGGASKGVIFALLKERAGTPVSTVIDINPAKQGKYLAATGLRVQAPAEALGALPAGSTIYVMNSHYLEEIRNMSANKYQYVGVDHE